jgi:DNA-binding NtrC family response regulator
MVSHNSSAKEPTPALNSAVRVAVIDADPTSRLLMRRWLDGAGFATQELGEVRDSEALLSALPDIVCIDLSIGGGKGHQVLQNIHATHPHIPVVVVMAPRDTEAALSVMRAGAFDYVTKPVDRERFIHAVRRASERHVLSKNVKRLDQELKERTLSGAMGGLSAAILALNDQVEHAIDRDVAVCLTGEEGSGKDLVARTIHERSARQHGPYVQVDCSALDAKEQEAVLFGAVQVGGATVSGAFEQASGGVLFLDHVGCLLPRAQATLAQALSNRAVRRVGGFEDIPVNVRVVAAHPEPLHRLVEDGKLREDLYFRLGVYPIFVPALRHRSDDIPLVVSFFLREFMADGPCHFTPEALDALVRYSWPGNVRQLEHVVHRSVLSARGEVIGLQDLPCEVRDEHLPSSRNNEGLVNRAQLLALPENEVVPLRDLERLAIEHALRVTHGSVSLAAQKLGIGRATLYRRLASLDLSQHVA